MSESLAVELLQEEPTNNCPLPLQTIAFKNSINSIVFEDEFKKLPKREQLKFIEKLIDSAGYVTVSNIPKKEKYEWHNNCMVAYDYVYGGKLPKEIYCRWAQIWKLISTQTYAVQEEITTLPLESYVCNLTIWGKKPPVELPNDAIIFEKPDGTWQNSFKTCEYYFNDKKVHLRLDRIRVNTYENPHPRGLLGLILSREDTINSWQSISYPMSMILRSNERTWYLENNGYDISSIPTLSDEVNCTPQ